MKLYVPIIQDVDEEYGNIMTYPVGMYSSRDRAEDRLCEFSHTNKRNHFWGYKGYVAEVDLDSDIPPYSWDELYDLAVRL